MKEAQDLTLETNFFSKIFGEFFFPKKGSCNLVWRTSFLYSLRAKF